jgi:selenocysteine lyase/cysteine desulfurase
MTRNGTSVSIVNQPVKVAVRGDRVFLEAHDYEDGRDPYAEALAMLEAKNLRERVDLEKIRKAIRNRTGLLTDVTK